jgi:CubicO group peptidase (beta-lactamase class C family)
MGDMQEQVQRAIDRLVASGAERGVQVAVYRRGELVADAVAGAADPATGRPVTAGTPFHNFSIGKGAASTVAHVLAERGLFGYETPVAELWPEFGAHGKATVTMRHVLTHSAGLPGVPPDTTPEDLCDWDKMCAAIAGARLWWEPGSKVAYHAYTFGYIIGEVVRRATGKPISQVLLEEVAGPLGVAGELYFGMPESEHGRLARLEDAEPMPALPADHPALRAGPSALLPTARLGNRTDILAADIPACGKTSARAIARMYAAVAGEVDGIRLISPQRLREATSVAASGIDEIFGNPSWWGLGYSIGRPGRTAPDTPATFGMGGAGGSFAYAYADTGIAFALTKNRLTADFSTVTQISEIVSASLPLCRAACQSGPPLRRVRDLVVADREIPLDQEAVVFRVEDRLLDVLAGESLDRLPRFPEAQGDDLRPVTVHPLHQPGPAITWRPLVVLDASFLNVGGIRDGILGPDRAAPDSRDHARILPPITARRPGAGDDQPGRQWTPAREGQPPRVERARASATRTAPSRDPAVPRRVPASLCGRAIRP